MMIDKKGIIASINTSWEITKGNFWKIFSLMLLLAGFAIVSLLFGLYLLFISALGIGLIFGIPNLYSFLYLVPQSIVGFMMAVLVVGIFTKAYLQARE